MVLEWVVLGYAAAAEAIMVLLLTIGFHTLRKGLASVTRNLPKLFLSIVPFCLFLLMEIYWKYENLPSYKLDSCIPSKHLHYQKYIMKSQRNALLIASALIFYWLLYSVTHLVVKVEALNHRVEKLKKLEKLKGSFFIIFCWVGFSHFWVSGVKIDWIMCWDEEWVVGMWIGMGGWTMCSSKSMEAVAVGGLGRRNLGR